MPPKEIQGLCIGQELGLDQKVDSESYIEIYAPSFRETDKLWQKEEVKRAVSIARKIDTSSPIYASKKTKLSDISVWIVDDHTDWRKTILDLLDFNGIQDTFGANSGEEALSAIKSQKPPDVILMDIMMPGGMTGIECTQRIKEIAPYSKIVMLTNFFDDNRIFESLQLGASGYLLKSDPPDQLSEVVLDTYNDGAVLSPIVTKTILQKFSSYKRPTKDYGLTLREMDVLKLMVEGLTKKEVAEKLFLSLSTIDSHTQNIYKKLNVNSATRAVAKAVVEGLVDAEQFYPFGVRPNA